MGGIAVGGKRMTVSKAVELASQIEKLLGKTVVKLSIAGSARRRMDMFDPESYKKEVGDLDLVVIPRKDKPNGGDPYWQFHRVMQEKFGCSETAKVKFSFKYRGVQVDILTTTAASWGAAMMHLTGPVELNIKQRGKAKSMGLTLNEKGLSGSEGVIAGQTEKEVYEALEEPFLEPTEREKFSRR